MTQVITRLYDTAQQAADAVAALQAAGFANNQINLVSHNGGAASSAGGQSADPTLAAIMAAGILRVHAVVYAERLRRGSSLITVTPYFGTGVAATQILDRFNPAETGIPEVVDRLEPWDDVTPISSLFGMRVLWAEATPFSVMWNVPVLLGDGETISEIIELPSLTRSSFLPLGSGVPGFLDKAAAFSSLIGLPALGGKGALFSSLTCLPVLLKRHLPRVKQPWLRRTAAPLSTIFQLPTLTNAARSVSGMIGLPMVCSNVKAISAMIGLPLLTRAATPLSSILFLPVLADPASIAEEPAPLSSALHVPTLSNAALSVSALIGLPALARKVVSISGLIGLPLLTRRGRPVSQVLFIPTLIRD